MCFTYVHIDNRIGAYANVYTYRRGIALEITRYLMAD